VEVVLALYPRTRTHTHPRTHDARRMLGRVTHARNTPNTPNRSMHDLHTTWQAFGGWVQKPCQLTCDLDGIRLADQTVVFNTQQHTLIDSFFYFNQSTQESTWEIPTPPLAAPHTFKLTTPEPLTGSGALLSSLTMTQLQDAAKQFAETAEALAGKTMNIEMKTTQLDRLQAHLKQRKCSFSSKAIALIYSAFTNSGPMKVAVIGEYCVTSKGVVSTAVHAHGKQTDPDANNELLVKRKEDVFKFLGRVLQFMLTEAEKDLVVQGRYSTLDKHFKEDGSRTDSNFFKLIKPEKEHTGTGGTWSEMQAKFPNHYAQNGPGNGLWKKSVFSFVVGTNLINSSFP
jgi:hypothetical protein